MVPLDFTSCYDENWHSDGYIRVNNVNGSEDDGMAAQTVQDIIRKAVADEGFRHLLLSNLDPTLFEGGAADLGDRISRGVEMQ
jgi:hypothetical protein